MELPAPINHRKNLQALLASVYPALNVPGIATASFLRDRAILAPRNDDVKEINQTSLEMFPGQHIEYLAADVAIEQENEQPHLVPSYPTDTLNSLDPSSLPPFLLMLKIGAPIMLLRNIAPKDGLCNGVRLIVKRCATRVIEAIILTGDKAGNTVFIPRITLTPFVAELAIPMSIYGVRVSGVMTNSPFMLNVDCDMFANNAQVVLHAMCLLLGSENEREIAYVQCPQHFYGGIKDDPFGASSLIVLQECLESEESKDLSMEEPVAFIEEMLFTGYHQMMQRYKERTTLAMGSKKKEAIRAKFGCSAQVVKSASQTLFGSHEKLNCPNDITRSLKIATQVADCSYESDTLWGTKIGWLYGSTAEDVLTGLQIHARGWRSAYLSPERSAFLGCAPFAGPAVMTQQKRWATGLLEVLFSKNSPILATIKANLKFRQCLSYLYINIWGLRSIPELCYVVLPAYCLLPNTYIFPKVSENAFWIAISLVAIYNLTTLSEYLHCGFSVKVWWNNQRMSRITATTAWLFGVLSVVLKLIGQSDTVFEITRKDQGDDGTNTNPGQFTFDDSPVFVPGTALVLLHVTALVLWSLGIHSHGQTALGAGLGEVICSLLVLLNFLPFLLGFFGKGSYGIHSLINNLYISGFGGTLRSLLQKGFHGLRFVGESLIGFFVTRMFSRTE
ncbi:hypothetical protein AQUCO_01100013v1 [Aquilegia coerulea]|nr:hypothetical protein AQUCO_01100013v1 [Aquilegia coerulea]